MADDYTLVACFGTHGSYSDEAMHAAFAGKAIEGQYYSQFEDVVQAVASGQRKYGVLPIENSSTGGITEVYDLIHRYDCVIVGEQYVRIEHNLLVLPGTKEEDITEVFSHPQGLAQCREFLKHHSNWKLHPYFSTSQSAQHVGKSQNPHWAAIANTRAGELYGLDVIVSHINDNTTNFTRFCVIAAETEERPGTDKLTIVITVNHEPGALYHVLGHFFYAGMNMTHLESRPIKGKPFEYFFHIDVMGSLHDPAVAQMLTMLKKHCKYFKVLGNYPADKGGFTDEIRSNRREIRT